MRYPNHVFRSGASLALAAVLPLGLAAQDADPEGWEGDMIPRDRATLDVEARGGVAVPAGDLATFAEPGGAAGLGAALWLGDHFAVRIDGDLAAFQPNETGVAGMVPDVRLYHYGAGLEWDVFGESDTNPWTLETTVGAGGTTLDTEDFIFESGGDVVEDVTETYANVNAGVEIGRELTEDVLLSLGSRVFYVFVDEDELEALKTTRPEDELVDAFSIPVTLSIRWDLPAIG